MPLRCQTPATSSPTDCLLTQCRFDSGATSEPSNSIERCIASVSSIAELIWKVMRDTPPRAVFASRTLSRTVFGLPIKNAPWNCTWLRTGGA